MFVLCCGLGWVFDCTAASIGVGSLVESGTFIPCDGDGSRECYWTEDAVMFEVPDCDFVSASWPHDTCCVVVVMV